MRKSEGKQRDTYTHTHTCHSPETKRQTETETERERERDRNKDIYCLLYDHVMEHVHCRVNGDNVQNIFSY